MAQEIRRLHFQVYEFDVVADEPPPAAGQIVCLKHTPHFYNELIYILSDGARSIRELYENWRLTQVSPSIWAAGLAQETQDRIDGDANLQQQVDRLHESAARALVFDNHAELNDWMSASPPVPLSPPQPAGVSIGFVNRLDCLIQIKRYGK